RVAHGGGQDADADPDALGHRERRRGLRDAAAEEAVLDHPELVEPECLRALRERAEQVRRQVPRQHDADGALAHQISLITRAGLPTATTLAGRSLVTTDPAP